MSLKWDKEKGYVITETDARDSYWDLPIKAIEYLNKEYPDSPITEFVDNIAHKAITSFHSPHAQAPKSSNWDLAMNILGFGEEDPGTYGGSPMVENYLKPHTIEMGESEYKPSSFSEDMKFYNFPKYSNIDEWEYQQMAGDTTLELKEGHTWDYYFPEVEELPNFPYLPNRWHMGRNNPSGPLDDYLFGFDPGEDVNILKEKLFSYGEDLELKDLTDEHFQALVEHGHSMQSAEQYMDFKKHYKNILQNLVDTKEPQRLLYHDEKGETREYEDLTISYGAYGPEEFDIGGTYESKYNFPLMGISYIDEKGEEYGKYASMSYPPINLGQYTRSLGYDPAKDQYYYSELDVYDFGGNYSEKYLDDLLRDRPDVIDYMKHKMKYGTKEEKAGWQNEIDKTIADYKRKDYLVRMLQATGEPYGLYERHYFPKDLWNQYLEYFNVEPNNKR